MNLDTKNNSIRVLIDTNVLISALGFKGNPRQILLLALDKKFKAVTSRILLAELHEVVNKKFPKLAHELKIIERKIRKLFLVVHPKETISVVRDIDDNRVLEAAIEGKCNFIITGDQDLLELQFYKDTQILTPYKFLITFNN